MEAASRALKTICHTKFKLRLSHVHSLNKRQDPEFLRVIERIRIPMKDTLTDASMFSKSQIITLAPDLLYLF